MASTKSACKRINTSERNRMRNKIYRSSIKSTIKKMSVLTSTLNEKDINIVRNLVSSSYSIIDRAIQKGIIHPNNGNAKKSSIMKQFKVHSATSALEV